MLRLYYHPLCPFSRLIRIILSEKSCAIELKLVNFWERSDLLAELNPAMELPILEHDGNILIGIHSLYEYLEEKFPERNLLGTSLIERAEARRVAEWFNKKFYNEVTQYIINERVLCSYTKNGDPNLDAIRAANFNISYHLEYIRFLLQERRWLAGEKMTIADFAAAAQLSVLDYLGNVAWDEFEDVKDWYLIIKSRPSFKNILNDRIPGFTPSLTYELLDF